MKMICVFLEELGRKERWGMMSLNAVVFTEAVEASEEIEYLKV